MAQASRRLRKTRRIKRERSIMYRIAREAMNQRDRANMIAQAAIKELELLQPKGPVEPKSPSFTITQVDETEGTEPGEVRADAFLEAETVVEGVVVE